MTNSSPQPDLEAVAGVVLRTGAADLLLPNAAVVEIISFRPPAEIEGSPPWLLGNLDWRERPVPVVSVAAAGGAQEDVVPGRRARLVVCYTPSGNTALPYLAFLSLTPPRLAYFHSRALRPAQTDSENPFVLHALTYVDRPAWIPDIDAIERAVLQALKG